MSAHTIAIVAAAGFLVIAAFQVALVLGAPLGRAAWGGGQARLPVRLRVASAVAVGIWILGALIVLGRAGFEISPLPAGFVRPGTWALAALLVLGGLMNLASRSPWERYLWGPFALALAVITLLVARSS